MVIVDRNPQLAMRITSAHLHVQSFIAWAACNPTRPTKGSVVTLMQARPYFNSLEGLLA
jgi:hypothetical protein